MKKLLFVCTGNICRSPTAHAVARHKIKNLNLEDKLFADSAATSSFHAGQKPDRRAVGVGLKKGINFSNIKARKVEISDFKECDLIFAMDKTHLEFLKNICPEEHQDKIHLFLKYTNVSKQLEVADPYHGGIEGFSNMFNLIDEAVEKIILKAASNP